MGGSGVQRPVKLAKYLPEFGWNPFILVPEPGAYYHFDESLLSEIQSAGISVTRVKAKTLFHAAASVAGGGRVKVQPKEWKTKILSWLTSWFFLPDNKTGWIEPALSEARRLIANHQIEAVIATAPPYSNLMIAAGIRQEFGLPVIMDFRDDWLKSHWISYPTRRHYRRMQHIESSTLADADALTVVNAFYQKSLLERTPEPARSRIYVVPNGYDPADFEEAAIAQPKKPARVASQTFTLLHSGRFYSGIQPDAILRCVQQFLKQYPHHRPQFKLQFQGGLTDAHRRLIAKLGLDDVTEDLGYLPHKQAVANLMKADALFLTLGEIPNIEAVTPGKLFEYIGSGKPVLAFLPEGISRELLTQYDAVFMADLTNAEAQQKALWQLFSDWQQKKLPQPDAAFQRQFSRKTIAAQFAELLSSLPANRSTAKTS